MNNKTSDIIEYFKKILKVYKCPKTSIYIYADHIPNAAYILISGSIIKKGINKSKEVIKITSPSIIGLKELYKKTKMNTNIEIQKDSEIMIIDLSSLNQAIKLHKIKF